MMELLSLENYLKRTLYYGEWGSLCLDYSRRENNAVITKSGSSTKK